MAYYPIFLQLEGMAGLVVGGGGVARRKVETLLAFGAKVSIVSRELAPELNRLIENGKIQFLGEEMEDRFFDDVSLVIAATDDMEFNHRVSEGARRRGLLINAVDQPADCTFIVPSIVRKGDLMIAISTSGKSPALSKKIRKRLETQFGDEYADFLNLMGDLRKRLLAKGLPQEENSRIFHEMVESNLIEALAQGDRETIAATLRRILPADMDMGCITGRIA
ncbi:MAG: bifunctional precorrin-2 dehydrogenase/sirohydrochlorin ferrochelatase [Deltaproteobacteria bacterium]|nr:bifunctional precorrin-2 dehydrogenase/sirohydrochlorin ferrochelatase [Deltaproteobacteria bacterium]